jgi:hypothetical protein
MLRAALPGHEYPRAAHHKVVISVSGTQHVRRSKRSACPGASSSSTTQSPQEAWSLLKEFNQADIRGQTGRFLDTPEKRAKLRSAVMVRRPLRQPNSPECDVEYSMMPCTSAHVPPITATMAGHCPTHQPGKARAGRGSAFVQSWPCNSRVHNVTHILGGHPM